MFVLTFGQGLGVLKGRDCWLSCLVVGLLALERFK